MDRTAQGGAAPFPTAAAQARRRVQLSDRSAQAADTERGFDPYGLAPGGLAERARALLGN